VYRIDRFRVMEGAVYCSGQFSDQKYRSSFKGVSPDNIAFAGDISLITEIKHPANSMTMDDMPERARAAAQSDEVLGLVGAACIDMEPAFGRHGIYRLRDNTMKLV